MGTTKQILQQPQLATPHPQANAAPPQQQTPGGPAQRMAQLAINNVETGSAVVDQGLGCDNAAQGTAGCVLTAAQRARLLPTYQARVTAAQQQYVAALIELRVDELLKKEPEQSDWVLELMLDIIGDLTLSSAMKAFSMLRGGAVDHLAHEVSDAHALAEAMREETTEQVRDAISKAVGIGKGKFAKGADKKAEENAEGETTQKTANLAFIDYLKDESATSYERLRETAPAGLSDTSFLILFESFRAEMGHTVGVYKEALEAKLKRFEGSGVGAMGVTRNKERQEDPTAGDILELLGPENYQTRAFWVVAPNGERRLALFRREAKAIDHIINRGDVMTRHQATPLEEAELNVEDAQREYTFMRIVPSEFEGVALSMHAAKFGAEPYEHKSTPKEAFLMGGAS